MRSSWKEIRTNLKPIKKAYDKFQLKRKIAKQKEEERRLKENEKQRLLEEESLRLQEQEERRSKAKEKQKLERQKRQGLINGKTKANQTSGKKYVRIGKKYV